MTVEEFRTMRRLGDLSYDLTKRLIGRCKAEATLDLNFQNGGLAAFVSGMNDDVIKGMTFGRPLKFDAIDRGAGQPSGLCTDQQGQQIVRTDLRLEMRTRWSAGCRTARVH